MRVAVIGHVEHVTIAAVAALPREGEIVHLDAPAVIAGGGGGIAFAQLARGPGDVHLFTALGNGDAPLHVAPRLSLVLPTGSEEDGRGSGSLGVEGNLPVSLVASDAFAFHTNTGFALDGESGVVDARLGASGILRVRRWVNFMLETVWSSEEEDVVFLNPGVRWAFDLVEGLQVVPGLAYTVAVGDGGSDALFLYLSLEHPFSR